MNFKIVNIVLDNTKDSIIYIYNVKKKHLNNILYFIALTNIESKILTRNQTPLSKLQFLPLSLIMH